MSAATATTIARNQRSTVSVTEMPESATRTVAEETLHHATETMQTTNGNDTIFSSSTAATTTTTTQTSIESSSTSDSAGKTPLTTSAKNVAVVVAETAPPPPPPSDENANPTTTTTATTTNGHHRVNDIGSVEDLKIVGHLRSIEQINEQRRLFLSNTISEHATTTTTTTTTEATKTTTTTPNEELAKDNKTNGNSNNNANIHNGNTNNNNNNNNSENNENLNNSNNVNNNNNNSTTNIGKGIGIGNGKPTHLASPDNFDLTPTQSVKTTTATTLPPSPKSPPPKPPMLSRTRSLNRGPSLTSPPQTPLQKTAGPVPEERSPTTPTPTSTVTVVSTTIAEPLKAETIELRELQPTQAVSAEPKMELVKADLPPSPMDSPKSALGRADESKEEKRLLRKGAQPVVPVPPTAPLQPAADKPIATSHYERLIEELKCPGCASPMKAPVLLCRTGHSSCEQCTRVLMLCPLCREPYSDMRSLTVEALCSKAHFRCANAAGGCTVRLHLDLLGWHEKQCIFKPMKCFMGRVWGDCQWSGREAYWKDHLTAEHGNRVFTTDNIDLIWNMGVKQKPLTGYYVFEVFGEMFNFYEIFDKERVLFTMTITSTVKEKKYNYAYEVTMLDRDSDALAITQKFPVHSEYDSDILQDGTCVSVPLSDLAKFIDEDRLLHYRVRITEVKTPRKMKLAVRHSCPPNGHQADFQQTRIEGVNLKNVPTDVILTRKFGEGQSSSKASPNLSVERGGGGASSSEDEIEKIRRLYYNRHNSDSESDPELDAFIAKRWGTPQLHFNRKYLRNVPSDISSSEDGISQPKNGTADTLGLLADQRRQVPDDRASISSTATNYRKRMTNSLRRSMRTLRVDFKALTSKASKTTTSTGDKQSQQPDTA